MGEEQFIKKMQDTVLDTDEKITMEMQLGEIEEWDSLAVVSFAAMANADGKSLSRDQIKGANTIRELYDMIKG